MVFVARAYMNKQVEKAELERLREKEATRMRDNDIWSTGLYSDVKLKSLRRAARTNAPSYFDYHNGVERQ